MVADRQAIMLFDAVFWCMCACLVCASVVLTLRGILRAIMFDRAWCARVWCARARDKGDISLFAGLFNLSLCAEAPVRNQVYLRVFPHGFLHGLIVVLDIGVVQLWATPLSGAKYFCAPPEFFGDSHCSGRAQYGECVVSACSVTCVQICWRHLYGAALRVCVFVYA